MKFLLFVLLISVTTANAQSILIMDFVKVKNEKYAETLFYYENNWKKVREIALEKNYIKSYRLEQTKTDSIAPFDLILITEYKDSIQYNNSEINFRGIISTNSPNGPRLLNDLKPAEFRQNVFVKVTSTLYTGKRTNENHNNHRND